MKKKDPQSAMNKKPRLIRIVGIVILAVILGILLISLVRNHQYRRLTSPTVLTEATQDWKTFESDECSCSFKYPTDWEVLENDNHGRPALLIKPKAVTNDWVVTSTGISQTHEGPQTITSEYINSYNHAAQSGIQIFTKRYTIGYNSGNGPLIQRPWKLGNYEAELELGLWDFVTPKWDRLIKLHHQGQSVLYFWPPNDTLVQILATLKFNGQ